MVKQVEPTIKINEEIEVLRQSGRILAGIVRELVRKAKPGVTTEELDILAEHLIIEAGGEPAFKGFAEKGSPAFPTALCTSLNNEVVHAPAVPAREIKNGDFLKIDVGMKWPAPSPQSSPTRGEEVVRGLYTDMAVTVAVGKADKEGKKLMEATKKALEAGIKQVRPGGKVSDIAKAVQEYAEGKGFSVVRDLVGHGVGYKVHEPPEIPNFWREGMEDCVLKEGMIICIEPMVNMGTWRVGAAPDGWTILTADGTLSAHFEHTVLVGMHGAEILTK